MENSISKRELRRIREMSRKREIEYREENGTPRSQEWGGKPQMKKIRKMTKQELRKYL